VRIISGKYKGKKLTAPKNLPVRPTTDFAKEALFNIVSNDYEIEQLSVLDLFSGTGNIAFEFASRGAQKIICIDGNYNCVNFIKRTANELDLKQLSAYKNDVFKYLKKYKDQFDIIFADPPYDLKKIGQISELVFQNNLLKKDGLLIIEHGRDWDFKDAANFVNHRKYSNVNFSLFKNE
jgi:16S rRNA (guanine(966)-N(2))-methyltransferase RsmD